MPGFRGGAVFTNANMTEAEKERNTVIIAPPPPVDPFNTSGGPVRYSHSAPLSTASAQPDIRCVARGERGPEGYLSAPIVESCDPSANFVILIISAAITHLNSNCAEHKLLWRQCGTRERVRLWIEEANAAGVWTLPAEASPADLTDLVIKLLFQIPGGLLSIAEAQQLIVAVEDRDLVAIHKQLCDIGAARSSLFATLIPHWRRVAREDVNNGMDAKEMATVVFLALVRGHPMMQLLATLQFLLESSCAVPDMPYLQRKYQTSMLQRLESTSAHVKESIVTAHTGVREEASSILQISRADFDALNHSNSAGMTEEHIKKVAVLFQKADRDNNGVLDRVEFLKVVSTLVTG